MKTPLSTRALWVGVGTSILLALYSFTGVLQAAMLFVGERAQFNAAIWGSVFLLALVVLVACSVALWRRYMLQSYATKLQPNISLNPDASPAALARRPLGAGQLWPLGISMQSRLRQLHIEVPQFLHGQLMNELSRVAGLVQRLADTPPMLTIHATVPAENVHSLEVWLRNASNGQGKVVSNKPANGGDA